MAIGIARCFGFHFEENFKNPYIATSVTEFWRRWHISLTKWFTDYVYIPLGGNRVSSRRHIINLAIIWLLTGIWHGANWTFIVWGMIYFVFQTIEKYTGFADKIPKLIGWIYTLLIVGCEWVIFKSDSIHAAFGYLGAMFHVTGNSLYDSSAIYYGYQCWRLFIIAAICCLPIFKYLKIIFERVKHLRVITSICYAAENIIFISLLTLSLFNIINGSYSPFIYFNF